MITSKDNPTIKYAASLQMKKNRDREDRFLIEGHKLVMEALSRPSMVELILVDESIDDARLESIRGFSVPIYSVASRLGRLLSDTETPQGIWAVCRKPAGWDIMEILSRSDLLLVLTGIQDPGNLGTMLRTAWAVGAGAVLLTPGTVDPYNPKVIRSAMGALFAIPVIQEAGYAEIGQIQKEGFKVMACTARGQVSLFETDLSGRIAMMVGSEGQGIPKEYEDVSDLRLCIPLQPGVESLNAGVACGIVLYEAYRQKHILG